MKMNPIAALGQDVSELCLGTMTYGTQTSEADSHAQIDMALDHGINFLDTAEVYPVNPMLAETVGRTEEIIGNWVAKSGRRNDMVIATKHPGEGGVARAGAPITGASISSAIDDSLRRLQCEVIDLYQFHWPNRGSYMFRKNWTYDPSGQDRQATLANMEDCLEVLAKEVARGRIRAFGLSNESCWGTTRWLDVADRIGGPRVATVQNEYSLLCRLYDTDMAEMSVNEGVGLLPFSPLAAGYLTGKYAGGAVPDGSRMSLVPGMGGRASDNVHAAVDAYLAVARKHGIDPVHMALAWSARRPFVTSSIFGATTLPQLEHALGAAEVQLSEELLADLDATQRAFPMPY